MVKGTSFETPLLRVSRPVSACSRCRAAKIKCDGKLPACSACERSGKANECSSANDQFAKGKERSYVASLETRVEKLEKRLAQARQRASAAGTHDSSSYSVPNNMLAGSIYQSRGGRAAQRKEASDVDDLVSGFGFLAVNATARDYYGFNSAMTYARLVLSASTVEELPSISMKPLPPRYETSKLFQHYMDNIHSFLPVISETSLYGSIDAVYGGASRRPSALDRWTVRMVLAIAEASLSHERGDAHYQSATSHAAAALENQERVLHPGQVSGIQAILLLVQYSILDPHHFDSWYLIGMASRAMVDLGLHQDPQTERRSDKVQLDMRQRVYYCVLSLDRSISMVHARACSFSDESTKVALPSSPGDRSRSHSPNVESAFLPSLDQAFNLFRVRLIQSACYSELFWSGRTPLSDPSTYICRARRELKHWFELVPPAAPRHIKRYFEVELLFSYIYFVALSARIPKLPEKENTFLFENCIEYAARMCPTVEDETQYFLYTFHDALRAYAIGRQFLHLLWQTRDQLLDTRSADLCSPYFTHPRLTYFSRTHSVTRAIMCIEQIRQILTLFGVRFDYLALRDSFIRESTSTLDKLYAKQNELSKRGHNAPLQDSELLFKLYQDWEDSDLVLLPGMSFGFQHPETFGHP
ncbi:putative C6 transcription factor [Xylona heveae TC161]|uniref:Putative C6 transcription factor n=1 Tax=Xylona heveae (strain CBS 132557 / TC161) TaxID=1328760 RepID=A0A165JMR9_XYLHT|nr:putative C6 transcription factor [Xylona heveae TC161]KZF26430.1 putative C6 transcription factor [Xylona heveae TC161]